MPEPLQPQLHLLRPSLEGLPPVVPPAGYAVRGSRPDEGAVWSRVVADAFNRTVEQFDFDTKMRSDPSYRPARILFACHGDEPVAVAAAFHRESFLPDAGMLHWVAVRPAHRGRRLGYWVSLAALHRMGRDGRRRAWLSTDDFRRPAIRTYLDLGFEPLLVHANQRARWRAVFAALDRPDAAGRFASILDGPVRHRPDQVRAP